MAGRAARQAARRVPSQRGRSLRGAPILRGSYGAIPAAAASGFLQGKQNTRALAAPAELSRSALSREQKRIPNLKVKPAHEPAPRLSGFPSAPDPCHDLKDRHLKLPHRALSGAMCRSCRCQAQPEFRREQPGELQAVPAVYPSWTRPGCAERSRLRRRLIPRRRLHTSAPSPPGTIPSKMNSFRIAPANPRRLPGTGTGRFPPARSTCGAGQGTDSPAADCSSGGRCPGSPQPHRHRSLPAGEGRSAHRRRLSRGCCGTGTAARPAAPHGNKSRTGTNPAWETPHPPARHGNKSRTGTPQGNQPRIPRPAPPGLGCPRRAGDAPSLGLLSAGSSCMTDPAGDTFSSVWRDKFPLVDGVCQRFRCFSSSQCL